MLNAIMFNAIMLSVVEPLAKTMFQ
jgi:hypothetical protein